MISDLIVKSPLTSYLLSCRLWRGHYILFGIAIAILAACTDSDNEQRSKPPSASVDASFLFGGPAGSMSVRLLSQRPFEDEGAPPFIGIYNPANVLSRGLDAQNQIVYPFAGLLGEINKTPNRMGNFRVGDGGQLIGHFYPNRELISAGAELRILPLLTSKSGNQCFQETDSGALQLIELPAEASELSKCAGYSGNASDFNDAIAGVEVSVDLGTFTEPGYFTLMFLRQLNVNDSSAVETIANDLSGRPALVNLTINADTGIELSPKVYAHGNFLPSRDGFGFSNLGDASADLLPKALLAEEFGAESVCFVKDGECAAINPYGLYLATRLQPHDTLAGLCNGMSVAATMLATPGALSVGSTQTTAKDVNPEADSAVDLAYNAIRQLIASKQVAQFAPSAEQYEKSVCPTLKPTDVIARIERGFNTDDPIAALTFYTAQHEAGHAVTPFAISDEGGNERRIYVYDSNFPSDNERFITVDTTPGAERWQYRTGTTAASAFRDYEGFELENTLCPMPLSVYADQQVLVQAPGTTRFVDLVGVNAQIIDRQGRVSGADLDQSILVNDIPNATLTRLIDTNTLTIANLDQPDSWSQITEGNLGAYLNEAYTLNAQVVTEASQQHLQYMHSAILSEQLTSAYDLNFIPRNPLPLMAVVTFKAHPSARLFTLENPPPGRLQLRIFTTLNDQQVGYTAQLAVAIDSLEGNDAVGVFADESGEQYLVFSYDSASNSNLRPLREGEQYLVGVTRITADEVTVFE